MIHTMLLQQGYDVGLIPLPGAIQGRAALLVPHIYPGFMCQQDLDRIRTPFLSGQVQRGCIIIRQHVNFGPPIQQEQNNIGVAIFSRQMQWCQAIIFRQVQFVGMLSKFCRDASHITADGALMNQPVGTMRMGGPTAASPKPASGGQEQYQKSGW